MMKNVTVDISVLEEHFVADVKSLLDLIASPDVSAKRKMNIMIAIESMANRAIDHYDQLVQKEENQQ